MSSVQNTNYSIASRLYEYHAKAISRIKTAEVRDQISIGTFQSAHSISQSEEINHKKTAKFVDVIKSKLDSIMKSDIASKRSMQSDTNLIELATSLNEADIALNEVMIVRDKIVSGLKQLMESSF